MRIAAVVPVFVLVMLATPGAHAQDIPIQLLFDGQPLDATAAPEFSCLDRGRGAWIRCPIEREAGTSRYVLPRPAPGEYTLHVEIDENTRNPSRFPGDYDVFFPFQVTADAPAELRVDMPKLMRVTRPWDNERDLDGMLAKPWEEKPGFRVSRGSHNGRVAATFEWDAVVPGAEYTYVVTTARNDPYVDGPEIVRGTTRGTKVTLRLPQSPAGHYFRFGVSARKAGRPVGDFITHDSGVQSWAYAFVVRDTSAAAVATATDRVRRAESSRSARLARPFIEEWKRAAPRPAWWDEIPDSRIKIRSLGDLMVLWQSGTNDDASRRRFYKLTYEGIVERPGDQDLAAEGTALMASVAETPDDRLALLEFGIEHFFRYDRRLDNCANCRIGDTTGQMVRDLADAYIAARRYTDAIAVIDRLVSGREADVSAYNLALTFETKSRAYWEMKEVDAAKAAIREGLRRFPDGWQADQLRRTLERYERATGVHPLDE